MQIWNKAEFHHARMGFRLFFKTDPAILNSAAFGYFCHDAQPA